MPGLFRLSAGISDAGAESAESCGDVVADAVADAVDGAIADGPGGDPGAEFTDDFELRERKSGGRMVSLCDGGDAERTCDVNRDVKAGIVAAVSVDNDSLEFGRLLSGVPSVGVLWVGVPPVGVPEGVPSTASTGVPALDSDGVPGASGGVPTGVLAVEWAGPSAAAPSSSFFCSKRCCSATCAAAASAMDEYFPGLPTSRSTAATISFPLRLRCG